MDMIDTDLTNLELEILMAAYRGEQYSTRVGNKASASPKGMAMARLHALGLLDRTRWAVTPEGDSICAMATSRRAIRQVLEFATWDQAQAIHAALAQYLENNDPEETGCDPAEYACARAVQDRLDAAIALLAE